MDDNYALRLIGGTISGANQLVKESTTIQLDDDLDASASKNFVFTMYLANLSANYSWQTLVTTITGHE